MGVMRVFQLPSVAKYCCVAKAQPATPGSTDTDEKSPNLHWLLLAHRVTTPPVASTVPGPAICTRSEEHTSELQSLRHLVCRLLLEKKKKNTKPSKLGRGHSSGWRVHSHVETL